METAPSVASIVPIATSCCLLWIVLLMLQCSMAQRACKFLGKDKSNQDNLFGYAVIFACCFFIAGFGGTATYFALLQLIAAPIIQLSSCILVSFMIPALTSVWIVGINKDIKC